MPQLWGEGEVRLMPEKYDIYYTYVEAGGWAATNGTIRNLDETWSVKEIKEHIQTLHPGAEIKGLTVSFS